MTTKRTRRITAAYSAKRSAKIRAKLKAAKGFVTLAQVEKRLNHVLEEHDIEAFIDKCVFEALAARGIKPPEVEPVVIPAGAMDIDDVLTADREGTE